MLMVHKMIDAVNGIDPRCQFYAKEGTELKTVDNLIRAAREAEKFDFGQLVLERKADGRYELPDLSIDEKEMWIRGYLPLPAPICWYECNLGDKRIGMIVMENNDPKHPEDNHRWVVMRVDQHADKFAWDGVLCTIDRPVQDWNSDTWAYSKSGNKSIPMNDEIMASVVADIMLSIYLTMMLNSKTTEVRRENAPDKLNRQREKKHQTPLFSHRIVNIVPIRWLRAAEREVEGTHAPPRLHWRRTHPRTYHRDTAREFIKVIWRFLVGRADHGVVSHEYRVQTEKGK